MMKKTHPLIPVGLFLNTCVLVCNRFIVHLPDAVSFPLLFAAITCLIIGAWKSRRCQEG
ncbi:MAG: hypothetical protein IJN44_02870 [Clostridia bacterium]|nr:hypothetical protein [Clostridia bacterium]